MTDHFQELIGALRPELHRYCVRMVGNVADAEDIVQDTLAKASAALPGLAEQPPLRPWLFRIAHNRAIDHLRSHEHRMTDPITDDPRTDDDSPEDALAKEQAKALAVARFCELPTQQRSIIILKDVLGHSNEEIADLLTLNLPGVKASLMRGRARLHALAQDVPKALPKMTPELVRWVSLFNARDWDTLRTMLTTDVELDLISRAHRRGPGVSDYFTNYDKLSGWRMEVAFVDGREAILLHEHGALRSFITLAFEDGRVRSIRDYYYVPYIMADATVARARALRAVHRS